MRASGPASVQRGTAARARRLKRPIAEVFYEGLQASFPCD